MANWHYYNINGEKVGPISTMALKELARQGLITPETRIENGNGRSAVAGNINGLVFPSPAVIVQQPESPPPASAAPPPARPVPSTTTQTTSSSWFYYDSKGQKVGPVPFNILQSLAEHGVITPGTALEIEGGRTAIAGSIEGLTFAETTTPGSIVAPLSVSEEIYGTTPQAFVAPTAVFNPFNSAPSTTANPFTGAPPASDNLSSVPVPVPNPSNRADSNSDVHHVQHHVQLPRNIIIGFGVSILLLIAGYIGYTKYEDYRKEQEVKKIFREASQQLEKIGAESQRDAKRMMNEFQDNTRKALENLDLDDLD